MGFFIVIACPWIVIAVLDMMAEGRRDRELEALGFVRPARPETSSYLTPDLPS